MCDARVAVAGRFYFEKGMVMRYLVTLGVILGSVSPVLADPTLTWTKSLNGGYDVYVVGVQGDDGAAGWNVDVTFSGTFHQNLAFGSTDVDTQSDANSFAADPNAGYDRDTDCWYYDEQWTPVAPDSTDVSGTANILCASLGSIPGTTFVDAPLVQLAVPAGTPITYSGVLSYKGADYTVSGTIHEASLVSLLVTENKDYGDIDIQPEPADPNNPQFLQGTVVTLAAQPKDSKSLEYWEIYDPNFPNDANHATIDANDATTFTMVTDLHVNAVWQCGTGVPFPLILAVGLLGMGLIARSRRG